MKDRTKRQYRSDVEALIEWANSEKIPATIEAFGRRKASQYCSSFVTNETDRKTANKKISAVSAYWRWLIKRSFAEGNPWSGQSLAKANHSEEEKAKRPFTIQEVRTLLEGNADAELADAMRVAAMSGARTEEIYRVKVADCADGWFRIRQSKTRAGVRRVPIHGDLVELVERRRSNKQPSAFLFHEAGEIRRGRERSMAVSKRFGTYRKRMNLDERIEGRRQSRVDFHSFRRFFITHTRNAGFDRAVVAAIVGHEAGNLTDDVYSGGPSGGMRRACVASAEL